MRGIQINTPEWMPQGTKCCVVTLVLTRDGLHFLLPWEFGCSERYIMQDLPLNNIWTHTKVIFLCHVLSNRSVCFLLSSPPSSVKQ